MTRRRCACVLPSSNVMTPAMNFLPDSGNPPWTNFGDSRTWFISSKSESWVRSVMDGMSICVLANGIVENFTQFLRRFWLVSGSYGPAPRPFQGESAGAPVDDASAWMLTGEAVQPPARLSAPPAIFGRQCLQY